VADLAFLKEQIGPLPAGAWLAVVGGGLAIGVVGRRRKATAAAAVPVPAVGASNAAGGGIYGGSLTGTTAVGTPKAGTVEEWIRQATDNLIGRGFVADKVTNALNHVFYPSADHPPTTDDTAIYNAATIAVGAPPTLPSGYLAQPAAYDPTRFYGAPTPGTVGTPTTAAAGSYFGLPGSGVAIDPNDPQIGKFGVWQTGTHTTTPPAGYRDYVLGILRQNKVNV
jgi:hypothetical protein